MSPNQSKRRHSIGYVYSNGTSDEVPSIRRSSYSSFRSSTAADFCSCECNAALLQDELECLRESTKKALHQSWDEVELLNNKCAEQEDLIQRLKAELKDALIREKELQNQAEVAKKELLLDTLDMNSGAVEDIDNFSFAPPRIITKSKSCNLSFNPRNSSDSMSSIPSLFKLMQLQRPSRKSKSSANLRSYTRKLNNDDNDTSNAEWAVSDVTSRQSSTVYSAEEYSMLKSKLHQREQEILALEEIIITNTKTFQDLNEEDEKEEED